MKYMKDLQYCLDRSPSTWTKLDKVGTLICLRRAIPQAKMCFL